MKSTYSLSTILVVFFILSCEQQVSTSFPQKWVDLTYSFDTKTPFWPTAEGFRLDTVAYGMTPQDYFYSAFEIKTAEHGGTHIDAPIHFAQGRQSVDEIPLERLIAPGILIDISQQSSEDVDYRIRIEDITAWEKENGRIPDGTIVLFRTGYGKFWPNKKLYMGTDETGPSAVLLLHFPGLHYDAATWLVDNRKVAAIGIDTPSIDFGRSSDFRAHRILMEENIPAFENLANLDQLPSKGFQIVALPMKIRGGSGGPLRIIAGL